MRTVNDTLRGDRLGRDDDEVHAAVKFALRAAVAGLGFVLVGALWVSTCGPVGVDTAACGRPERALLAIAGPLILLAGGLWAFLRTYQVWRECGTWWGWHGAGWFLMTIMIATTALAAAPIAGVVVPR
ncbi:hypothetical protein [Mycobacterium sp.]|uniref:hypothetical protein n=1 Tax=Mycobacterium sp. TaxID=1785 RepID=UPI003A8672AB